MDNDVIANNNANNKITPIDIKELNKLIRSSSTNLDQSFCIKYNIASKIIDSLYEEQTTARPRRSRVINDNEEVTYDEISFEHEFENLENCDSRYYQTEPRDTENLMTTDYNTYVETTKHIPSPNRMSYFSRSTKGRPSQGRPTLKQSPKIKLKLVNANKFKIRCQKDEENVFGDKNFEDKKIDQIFLIRKNSFYGESDNEEEQVRLSENEIVLKKKPSNDKLLINPFDLKINNINYFKSSFNSNNNENEKKNIEKLENIEKLKQKEKMEKINKLENLNNLERIIDNSRSASRDHSLKSTSTTSGIFNVSDYTVNLEKRFAEDLLL